MGGILDNNISIRKANKLMQDGEYASAIECLIQIKKNRPIFSKIIDFNINLCRRRLGESAIDYARCACKLTKGVFAGIASIPEREESLYSTLKTLINQVDAIGVYLDGYEYLPGYIDEFGGKVRCVHSCEVTRDLGDAGKFLWVENHSGYYFTCDDDLLYPVDYISKTIACLQKYGDDVVVGWHGSFIIEGFESYYDKKSRRVFAFGSQRAADTAVHILGTGCLGFNTNKFSINIDDFKTPNMADVYFAIKGQRHRIPFIVLKHESGEIKEAESSQNVSIYKHSAIGAVGSRKNTKDQQNAVVKSHRWQLHYADRSLKITIIGRFAINKKGGIFKSSNLLANSLKKIGHSVDEICISDSERLHGLSSEIHTADFLLAYAPDPGRPDFGALLNIIENQAKKGVVCAVNFSIDATSLRSRWIKNEVTRLNSKFDLPRVFVAAFTNSSSYIDDDLRSIAKYVVTLPKTLDPGTVLGKNFHQREGIFLGDQAKLLNEKLVLGNSRKWIEQIRARLPHVNIYTLNHYHTDQELLDYIKVIPYNESGLGEILSSVRLCACLTPGATFEMIPVEAAMHGTPVLHRSMPQSLSEYLSPVSVEVLTPGEFGYLCSRLYESENIWEKISACSLGLHDVLHVNNLSALIDVSIRKCIYRSKNIE